MNRAFGGAVVNADDNSTSAISRWTPAVDIHEEQERYVISAAVPGVDPRCCLSLKSLKQTRFLGLHRGYRR